MARRQILSVAAFRRSDQRARLDRAIATSRSAKLAGWRWCGVLRTGKRGEGNPPDGGVGNFFIARRLPPLAHGKWNFDAFILPGVFLVDGTGIATRLSASRRRQHARTRGERAWGAIERCSGRSRAVLDSARDAIWSWDETGTIMRSKPKRGGRRC
jgi:PAS domain-containing protein